MTWVDAPPTEFRFHVDKRARKVVCTVIAHDGPLVQQAMTVAEVDRTIATMQAMRDVLAKKKKAVRP